MSYPSSTFNYTTKDHGPIAITHYLAAEHILPKYDWLYVKQNDLLFVNFDIAIENITKHIPHDKHMAFTAGEQFNVIDVTVLFRNSNEV